MEGCCCFGLEGVWDCAVLKKKRAYLAVYTLISYLPALKVA